MLQQAVRLGRSVRTPGPSFRLAHLPRAHTFSSTSSAAFSPSSIARDESKDSSSASRPEGDKAKEKASEAGPSDAAQKPLSAEGVSAVGAGFSRALLFPGLSPNPTSSSSSVPATQDADEEQEVPIEEADHVELEEKRPSSGLREKSSPTPLNQDDAPSSQRRPSPSRSQQNQRTHHERDYPESTRVLLTNLPLTATPWDLHRLALQNRARRHEPGARVRVGKNETETLSGSNGLLSIKPLYTKTWRATRTAVLTFDRPSRAKAYVQHVRGLDRTSDSRDVVTARLAPPNPPPFHTNLPPTHSLLHYLLLPTALFRQRSSTSPIVLLRGLPPHLTEERLTSILTRHYRLDLSPSWPKPRRTALASLDASSQSAVQDMPKANDPPRPVIRLENPFGPSQVTATFVVRLDPSTAGGDASRLVRRWDRMVWAEELKGGAKARERREAIQAASRRFDREVEDVRRGGPARGGKWDEDGIDEEGEGEAGGWGRNLARSGDEAGKRRGELVNEDESETFIVEADMLYPG